jgi:hexosaminidase
MKYDATTALGLEWAGHVDTRTAYEWEPTAIADGVPPVSVIGVEAPLWTETIVTLRDVETMLLPRLPGYAEIGWSAPEGRGWEEYQYRLAAHASRWAASGRSFTRDPVVAWAG